MRVQHMYEKGEMMLREDKVGGRHKYSGTQWHNDGILHCYSPPLELVVVRVQGRDIGLDRACQRQDN